MKILFVLYKNGQTNSNLIQQKEICTGFDQRTQSFTSVETTNNDYISRKEEKENLNTLFVQPSTFSLSFIRARQSKAIALVLYVLYRYTVHTHHKTNQPALKNKTQKNPKEEPKEEARTQQFCRACLFSFIYYI
ncbi:hypothetical protein ACOSP7_032818 [Xanthoceras sorbifolium]